MGKTPWKARLFHAKAAKKNFHGRSDLQGAIAEKRARSQAIKG